MNLGPGELIVVLMVALIVLGPKRLPEAARTLGKAMNEIKKVTSEVQSEFHDAIEPDPPRISGDIDITKEEEQKPAQPSSTES